MEVCANVNVQGPFWRCSDGLAIRLNLLISCVESKAGRDPVIPPPKAGRLDLPNLISLAPLKIIVWREHFGTPCHDMAPYHDMAPHDDKTSYHDRAHIVT